MKTSQRSRLDFCDGSPAMSSGPEEALAQIAGHLRRLKRPFALVGGLAVSVRAEVRFTRDVDLVVTVSGDADAEQLISELGIGGYRPLALVEHETQERLATVRLASPSGMVVDIITATCGIEEEIVARATPVNFGEIGEISVAIPEDLLAMKILSMTNTRLQDRLDASNIIATNTALDMGLVRSNLQLITERGFQRNQDLLGKLEELLRSVDDSN
jgi:hypothetical protein